jgi:hypothetical protein
MTLMKKTILCLLGWFLAASTCWANAQFKLLVLGGPNKYHYEYIPVARESLERLGKLHAFDFTWATQTSPLEGELKQYAAIVLMNTSGEDFNDKQRKNFEDYIKGGGHVVVVHRAMIIPPNQWPWYEKLVGRSFKIHPMLQTGVIDVVDKTFPANFGLPARWIWSDEWYELTNPHNVQINTVLNVDETSYDPTRIWPGQVAKGMGKDHPVSWYRLQDKSRVFVTTLGHNVEMYKDPQFLSHLMGGIYWTVTGKGQSR